MNELTRLFNGFRLIETTAITKQIQRKTHRKRRINKKWRKYGYREIPDYGKVVVFDRTIFAQPETIRKLRTAAEKMGHEVQGKS